MTGQLLKKILVLSDRTHVLPVAQHADRIMGALQNPPWDILHADQPALQQAGLLEGIALLHVQHHPAAAINVALVSEAGRRGIPVVVTCHELLRAEPAQRDKVHDMLKLADAAVFTNSADEKAALARHRHLKNHTSVLSIGSNMSVTQAAFDHKCSHSAQLLQEGAVKVVHFGEIMPHKGVGKVMQAAQSAGGIRFNVTGRRCPEFHAYADELKTDAQRLGVAWNVSDAGAKPEEILHELSTSAFAYLPFGKGGASAHSSSIPMAAEAGTLIISHRGSDTAPELESVCHFIDRPEDVAGAVRHYQRHPEEYAARLASARTFALPRRPGNVAVAYESLYRELTQKSRSASTAG